MTCSLPIRSSTYYPHFTCLFILLLFYASPKCYWLTTHTSSHFLPPPFYPPPPFWPPTFKPPCLICHWWRPQDWGQNVWLTLTSVPPRDRLELFPETINIERHQCENMKIASIAYDAIVKYNTRHMMRKLHDTINWSFTEDLAKSVYTYVNDHFAW